MVMVMAFVGPGFGVTTARAASGDTPEAAMESAALTLVSPAFQHGRPIPVRFTADGENVSPELRLTGVPPEAASLALVMDDPDAPSGTWVHWVVWNIPAGVRVLEEGAVPPEAVEGVNSWGRRGYGGPSPPSGTHRYVFKVYALDRRLDLPETATKKDLEAAMQGHVLAGGRLVGTYSR